MPGAGAKPADADVAAPPNPPPALGPWYARPPPIPPPANPPGSRATSPLPTWRSPAARQGEVKGTLSCSAPSTYSRRAPAAASYTPVRRYQVPAAGANPDEAKMPATGESVTRRVNANRRGSAPERGKNPPARGSSPPANGRVPPVPPAPAPPL